MASISTDKNGNRCIQFIDKSKKRQSIRLGKRTEREITSIKRHIEHLNAAKLSNMALPRDTSLWVADLDAKMNAKLAAVGLVEGREVSSLVAWVESFINKKAKTVKESTLKTYSHAQRNLLDFFDGSSQLEEITPGDAEDFRDYLLGEGLAEPTVRKRCSISSQIFKKAMKHRLISSNPFEDVPKSNLATERLAFVDHEDACSVLDELPNNEWKLLFALARWGGLRVGSEVRLLRWRDIDWEKKRLCIRSPKTEKYANGDRRDIPMFPELERLLIARFLETTAGETLVLPMLATRKDASLRKTLISAIRRADLEVWPRLWHNLRATRQTELTQQFSSHVACGWIGNSEEVARKHYLQITEADFEKAVQNAAPALQQGAAIARMTEQGKSAEEPEVVVLQHLASSCENLQEPQVVREGLEPPTKEL